MSIQIVESSGTFHLKGKLVNYNCDILSSRLTKVLSSPHQVVLNLEKVDQFDAKAAFTLLKIFVYAAHCNTKLSLVGKKNKNLVHILRKTETFDIWTTSNTIK